MPRWYWFFICSASIYFPLHAYKILIFNPRFGKSHVRFLGAIADILVEAGHNVTQLSPILSPLADTNGSRLAKTITIQPDPKQLEKNDVVSIVRDSWKQNHDSVLVSVEMFKRWTDLLAMSCELQLNQRELMSQLKAEKFDLAISELLDPCPLGMIQLFQIPVHLFISTTPLVEYASAAIGIPNIPSYVPGLHTAFTDEMTYFQRAGNLLNTILTLRLGKQLMTQEQAFFRKLYDVHIDFEEKYAQGTYIMTNTDPFFDIPKPSIHKLIEIGGVAVPEPKPLSKKWNTIMNKRKKAMLVSFGSLLLAHLMPNESKRALLETFDHFPDVTFIWKYEKEEHHIADGHPNVITGKWLPQTDLLAHPNLVAFLTQGGMNSLMETARLGKPVLVVPVACDQLRNAKLVERSGSGIMLSDSDLSVKDALISAFDRILNNESYAQKAKLLAKMIAKRPNSAKEQLLKHVEFAIEFGPIPNFDPYGRKMSFMSYYMLDIIIPFILLVLTVLAALCYVFYKIFRKFVLQISTVSSEKEKEKKNK